MSTHDDHATHVPSPTAAHPVVRSGADLLALVPYLLGFRPEDSVVLVTTRADAAGRHLVGPLARLDVEQLADPTAGEMLAAVVVDRMVTPATARVVLVAYSPDDYAAARVDPDLHAAVAALQDGLAAGPCRAAGDGVWLVAADGWGHLAGCHCCPPSGEPLQALEDAPLVAEMVLAGRVVHRTRDDLAVARVGPDAQQPAELAGLAEADRRDRTPRSIWQIEMADLWDAAVAQEPGPATLGRLLLALADTTVRDAALAAAISGGRARDQLDPGVAADIVAACDAPDHEALDPVLRLAERVAAHAPTACAGPALGLLTYLVWWSGDGARADVLARQTLAEDPGHRLADLVRQAIAGAVPPPWAAPAAR